MTVPRVAVSGVVRNWESVERTGVNTAYIRALVAAGGLPITVSPLLGVELADQALAPFDALVLTGGEDVDPSCYAAPPSPRLGLIDRLRDRFELALFRDAQRRGLPVLGICRGLQLINVAMGGTLWQDLPSERPGPIDHSPSCNRDVRTHGVHLEPGSRAIAALGTDSFRANSIHHQAIRDLAPGLRATAWSEDGLIEAVESVEGSPWLLAVQWHPEELHLDAQGPDRGLFAALVNAAAAYRRGEGPERGLRHEEELPLRRRVVGGA